MGDEPPAAQQITAWLTDWRGGDQQAPERLFAVLYPELRRIAARLLHKECDDHTLEPSGLVDELCVRLLGSERVDYKDRAHFFAVAARAMRRILIDYARARVAGKRGGPLERVDLSVVDGWSPVTRSEDLLALDEALSKLEQADPRAAQVVQLRFFGGLREDEVAEVLGVSIVTVKRDWKVARAWLLSRLQPNS